ncbi:hypothetical protein Ddye_032724 [Dipteronia dyeriana]|uniref:RING-type domain-containing protein n=1 Tax=Dipteronia dyeriana TaxID=168575 RepID=A0AAD9TCL4_9ROSI|nr:hypothetical protein Ddye_032724 [Dipteronia dyeriana]
MRILNGRKLTVELREEVLSMFIDDNDDDNSISVSISPLIAPEDAVSVERVGAFGNLEWEFLLNTDNLETNPEMDNDEPFFASKSVVENLPEVALTQEDVESNNALCAVCKDEISIGEKAKQLPCAHRIMGIALYHGWELEIHVLFVALSCLQMMLGMKGGGTGEILILCDGNLCSHMNLKFLIEQ